MAAAMAVVAEEEAGETAAAAVEVAVGFESAVAAAAMAAAAVEAVEAVEAVVAVGSCRPQCTGAAAGSVVAGTAAETAAEEEEEEEKSLVMLVRLEGVWRRPGHTRTGRSKG